MGATKRILQFIEYKGITKYKFCKDLGFSNKFLDNSSNMGTDKACKILHYFPEINPLWLLTGKGEMLKSNNPIEVAGGNLRTPQVVTVDKHQEDNVVLVPVKAHAGYLSGYDDPEFIKELPTYSLPNINNGIFRMFQVNGYSMYPTLQNNSYVVGRFVDDFSYIRDNHVYVVVTREHGIIVKRILNRINKYGNLYCKSDNREYPNIPISPEDIVEIWECKMQLSFEFLDPVNVYTKLSDLEGELLHLKEKVRVLEEEK